MSNKHLPNKIVFLFGIIVLLSVLRIYITNSESTEGEKINRMITEISEFQKSNQLLSTKVASESAYLAISGKAIVSGFTYQKSVISLLHSLPLAFISDPTP